MKVGNEAKIDAFLAIRGLFDPAGKNVKKRDGEIVDEFDDLSSFDDETRESLRERSKRFSGLNPDQQRVWLTLWRERFRRRGHSRRLDSNVHAEQVAEVLKKEPLPIRSIIESNLPDEIAGQVSNLLQSKGKNLSENRESKADARLVRIIRERFLSNFVAFEDLFKPTVEDRFSTRELGNLIWNLGIRETARVCRGIGKIENLAGFLQRFEDQTAKEIGAMIPEIKNVGLKRVREAEGRVKRILNSESVADSDVRRIGMVLFAEALSSRSDDVIRFNLQKLPIAIGRELGGLIDESRRNGGFDENAAANEIASLANNVSKGVGR